MPGCFAADAVFLQMSLYISSLNSGSNGNCYYIGNGHEAILVDAGLTCRETEKRMRRLDLHMKQVKAIFISHEHGDHIKGVEVISAKYNLPVYITPLTWSHSRLRLQTALIKPFKAYEPVTIGGLTIHPFPKHHDAADAHSFVVAGNGVNIGVFTDIGTPCDHLTQHFSSCHAVFLEANYDEAMLAAGRYPIHLQRRISGDHGHLSNRQALELFLAHRPAYMSHVLLAHLSKDNNDPELALQLFRPHMGAATVAVASRYSETEVYHIQAGSTAKKLQKHHAPQQAIQATLF